MKRIFIFKTRFIIIVGILLCLLGSTSAVFAKTANGANNNGKTSTTITVNVDTSSPTAVSVFNTGMSQVDNSLMYPWANNNANAVNNATNLLKNGISFVNLFIQAWGADDIWPDPSVSDPTKWNWSLLDSKMLKIVNSGAVPVITLAEAPWWMKGQLQKDGTTKLIPDINGEWSSYTYSTSFQDYRGLTYPAGYVSPDPYSSRVLDNQMSNWVLLIQEVAKRYMATPYNVRYFQVWNEFKGYYNPTLNRWDYENNQGDPSGYNAKNGYTYMYNQAYNALISSASSIGISASSIYVGGPYVVMDTWTSQSAGGWPCKEAFLQSKDYGTYDQRPLDVVKYWLQNKVGAGFITIDGSASNRDTNNNINLFTASEKFADVTKWIRSLDNNTYPGAQTLPIWWAEWYDAPNSGSSSSYDSYNNALKSYAMAKMIQSGVTVPLEWGANIANNVNDAGLWTPTNVSGGGQALPWYNSYKILHDYFSKGTQLYITNVSDPSRVEAISSLTKTLLINKTNTTLTVMVNNLKISLAPWEVKLIDNK
jgi:hypothetical protein